MGKISVAEDAPDGDFLSAAEISAAFNELTPDDKLKLSAIEAIKRRGTRFGTGELVHEAVCRALIGRRNCPREVPFMAFLVETIRSISSHERKKHRRSIVREVELPSDGMAEVDQTNPLATDPSPEDRLIEKEDAETVQTIHNHFEDDPEAQLLLMGWADGLRGAELREATGLDQAALDYAAKRIRTRMRKLYPEGWVT